MCVSVAMYTTRYITVSVHASAAPFRVVTQQHLASNRAPMHVHDDFLTLTAMSNCSSSCSQTCSSD